MIVSAIVAVAENQVIGDGGDIPWRLSSDLKYFKRITSGHHIIMGRKTFDSVDKPLPKRTNVVLTRDPMYAATGTIVAHSIEEALSIAYDNEEEEVFIIGGGEIYAQSRPFWDKVYLTRVKASPEGKVVFPALDEADWKLISQEEHQAGDRDQYDFTFEVYSKK